jgi:stearoyl-CoA desaturase (delta-9 desaturase)
VADHRKHHAFADQPATRTARMSITASAGAVRCAASARAHGWLFLHTQRGSRKRYAPDLLADPVVSFAIALPLVGHRRPRRGVRAGWLIGGPSRRAHGLLWAARCGCSCCTT